MTSRRYLILAIVTLTSALGDTFLAVGMKQLGPVSLHHLSTLIVALKVPWVLAGIVLLIGFFASYLTALSWADVTFVLPATSFAYVVVALLSRFWLHEQITPARWLGIFCIVAGVGFVTRGPSYTEHPAAEAATSLPVSGNVAPHSVAQGRSKALIAGATGLELTAMLAVNIATATAGDILIASAFRQIGDLDVIKARDGILCTILTVLRNARFLGGFAAMAVSFFSLLFTLSHADVSLVAPAVGSLTFVTNAIAARIFLKERVDKRRWVAALFVCCGVALLKH